MTAAPRAVWWAFAAIGVWLVAAETRVLLFGGIDAGPLFERFGHDVVLAICGALCVYRALRSPTERLPWLLIGCGVLAWTFGETYFTTFYWTSDAVPVPSPADLGYLLMPVLLLAGLVLLLRARTVNISGTLLTDGVTAALAVGAVSAAIVFESAMASASGNPLAVATTLAYPIFDLILLAFVVGALAGTGWRLDRTWTLLALGVLIFSIADSLYLVQVATDVYEAESWFDAGWWLGLALICFAAWQPRSTSDRGAAPEEMRAIIMPLLFAVTGLGLLIYASFGDVGILPVALAAAAMVSVMARLILTFGENRRMLLTSRSEALADPLTGLPNRRALERYLERALPRRSDDPPLVLALFDLDGFKLYNDTFGHPAGDALLVRLGTSLRSYLDVRGEAFRVGGDEFCAIFEPQDEVIEPIVRGAAGALSEHGEGFTIGCSYGSISLPHEAAEASEALRIADLRMYAQKNAGRASASRQSTDVLRRALAERNPRLFSHLEGVAALAERVARSLALTDDQVEQVRHTAELHDVGKVAIPDAILNKPEALDESEWAFMRRQTLIGERIISAAPALRKVALLVRSSHEHWDGGGYPDALAGRDIPLGSRIVAVADAFDAMTAERPYAAARSPAAALAELRRCAGTQFDPVVVEEFCAVWAQRTEPVAVV